MISLIINFVIILVYYHMIFSFVFVTYFEILLFVFIKIHQIIVIDYFDFLYYNFIITFIEIYHLIVDNHHTILDQTLGYVIFY